MIVTHVVYDVTNHTTDCSLGILHHWQRWCGELPNNVLPKGRVNREGYLGWSELHGLERLGLLIWQTYVNCCLSVVIEMKPTVVIGFDQKVNSWITLFNVGLRRHSTIGVKTVPKSALSSQWNLVSLYFCQK